MIISNILSKSLCVTDFTAKNKPQALEALALLLHESPTLQSIPMPQIVKALSDRESVGSTGLGNGIAIPHAKIKGIDTFVLAIAVAPKPISFNAADNKKVNIFCAFVGPENKQAEHLKILSSLSLMLRDANARRELRNAKTSESLFESALSYTTIQQPPTKPEIRNKLAIITLYQLEYLEDILELFVELDINGSTVIDSIGMGGILTKVPLFADFINFLGQDKNYSKTIFAQVSEKELYAITNGIEQLIGDLDIHNGVSIIGMDITFSKGTLEYR